MAPDTADLSVRLSAESTETHSNTVTGLKTSHSEKLSHSNNCEALPLTQVVPDVHLSAQGADLDDGLAEEVVRLPLELLLHAGLDVVVLVPHSHLDAVGGVVTLAERGQETRRVDRHDALF